MNIEASIISNRQVISGFYLMWLDCSSVASTARPGQFVMVRCGSAMLRRPLSVHQVDGYRFALLYMVVGRGTEWLSERQPGEGIDLIGPLGNGFAVLPGSKKLLLVAGGIGIAPLVFLAERAVSVGGEVCLLYGTGSRERCQVPEGVRVIDATEDGSVGYCGVVTDLILEHADWADQVFTCGPLSMYRTMLSMPELKDRSVQVSLEMRMGCGFGVCYSCTVRTSGGLKQVCRDGPVFELSDIMWDKLGLL